MTTENRNTPFAAVPDTETIDIEFVGKAGVRQRAAHRLLRSIRPALHGAVAVVERSPLDTERAFRIANVAERALAPVRPPRGTKLRRVDFGDFRAEWVWHRDDPAPESSTGAILYFHGGVFVAGGLHSHRRLVAQIARASGLPLLNVDYRQMPRAGIAEIQADAVSAYRHLLYQGMSPERIVLAGDSAGGGLAFSVALAAREQRLPMPCGIAAIAPWANYDSVVRLRHPNEALDPVLSSYVLDVPAAGLAGGDILDPHWSPVNHDFTGLPTAFIQVGSTEVLLPDAEQLATRCAEAGVPYTLQVWDRAIHDFQVAADLLPEARKAIADIGTFIARITESSPSVHTRGSHR